MKRLKLEDPDEDFYGHSVAMAKSIGGDGVAGPVSQMHYLLTLERTKFIKELRYRSSQLLLRMSKHDLEFLYAFILSCSLYDARRALELEMATSKIMLFGLEVVLDEEAKWPQIKLKKAKLKKG